MKKKLLFYVTERLISGIFYWIFVIFKLLKFFFEIKSLKFFFQLSIFYWLHFFTWGTKINGKTWYNTYFLSFYYYCNKNFIFSIRYREQFAKINWWMLLCCILKKKKVCTFRYFLNSSTELDDKINLSLFGYIQNCLLRLIFIRRMLYNTVIYISAKRKNSCVTVVIYGVLKRENRFHPLTLLLYRCYSRSFSNGVAF